MIRSERFLMHQVQAVGKMHLMFEVVQSQLYLHLDGEANSSLRIPRRQACSHVCTDDDPIREKRLFPRG